MSITPSIYIRSYIDYEAFANDLEHEYWISDNGHVFRNI